MLGPVLDFVACLRAGDMRVSTAEVLDLVRQLTLVDCLDEAEFRTALRANFVKDHREQPRFDRLYDLFFHGLAPSDDDAPDLDFVAACRDEQPLSEVQTAIIDFVSGDPLGLLEILKRIQNEQEAPVRLRFNLGPLASRLEVLVALNTVRDLTLRRAPSEAHAGLVNHRLDRAYRLLMDEGAPERDAVQRLGAHEQHHKALGARAFGTLSAKEVIEMRAVINELVRKLKDIMGRRYAAMNRGVLDVKKTLRLAQRYQGVPIDIRYHRHPKRKARIVTLCDVSNSVWSAARFMLGMLYSLAECFSEVRSFIFVAGLAEVTEIFKDNEVNQAVDKVLKETDLEYNVPTDYGTTLGQFKAGYMDTLDKRTTLVVIGDARSNYLHPQERILGEMRERCRRVIWINPEPVSLWNVGDSEMYAYEPYCHEVRSVRNLNQLMEFIRDLVL